MTIQSSVVYPHGLAQLTAGSRRITLTNVLFQETYGGIIEGAPRPDSDAARRSLFLAELEHAWGRRATHVVPPEVVEIDFPGRVIRRMPGVACAAWLVADPVAGDGAASELVLVWWTESLGLPVGAAVERALDGVEWERVAQDFDY